MEGYDFNKYITFVDQTLNKIVQPTEGRFVFDEDILKFVLHFLLNIKEGFYNLADLKTVKPSLPKIWNILEFIQNNPYNPIIFRSGIEVGVFGAKKYELVESPLYNALSFTQRIVLYLFSRRDKYGSFLNSWALDRIKSQMGRLFYKIGYNNYEITPDGMYMGYKIQEIITQILDGTLTLENGIRIIKDPPHFIRYNRYPVVSKNYRLQYPLEVVYLFWNSRKYFGLDYV
ncbi:hypothetical protein LCGC14_2841020 [marine sediment metagenome]|uniref:Uncharacterized protein n=1 Tax=marine sediment metagenome TaxID=412755 RepID=A0A0F8YXW0_9ZZZZ